MRRRPPKRKGPFDDRLLDDEPDEKLDLHHRRADEARVMVRDRIQTLARHKRGCLLHIVTGKGNHSPNGSRLKPVVNDLLKGELRGFIAEHDLDVDGSGFLVRLR